MTLTFLRRERHCSGANHTGHHFSRRGNCVKIRALNLCGGCCLRRTGNQLPQCNESDSLCFGSMASEGQCQTNINKRGGAGASVPSQRISVLTVGSLVSRGQAPNVRRGHQCAHRRAETRSWSYVRPNRQAFRGTFLISCLLVPSFTPGPSLRLETDDHRELNFRVCDVVGVGFRVFDTHRYSNRFSSYAAKLSLPLIAPLISPAPHHHMSSTVSPCAPYPPHDDAESFLLNA